jgi:hypothetical protein
MILYVYYIYMFQLTFIYPNSGAGFMRGKQILDKLQDIGYNINYDINIRFIKLNDIKKKINQKIKRNIIILIKVIPTIEILDILKKNKNIIIYDILDYSTRPFDINEHLKFNSNIKKHIKYFNYLLTINNYMKQYFIKHLSFNESNIFVIPHHWDIHIIELSNKYESDVLKICYIGNISHANCMYVDKIDDVTRITNIDKLNFHTNDNNIYNCHFNIRETNSWHYKFKSCVKLATAAALNCNIITTRDNSITELLPDDYPYYTTDKYDDVLKTIQYAKDTYNTDIWHKGLKQMADIKIKTSLDETIKLYIQLLNKINDI